MATVPLKSVCTLPWLSSSATATVNVEPAVTGLVLDGPAVIAIWLGVSRLVWPPAVADHVEGAVMAGASPWRSPGACSRRRPD